MFCGWLFGLFEGTGMPCVRGFAGSEMSFDVQKIYFQHHCESPSVLGDCAFPSDAIAKTRSPMVDLASKYGMQKKTLFVIRWILGPEHLRESRLKCVTYHSCSVPTMFLFMLIGGGRCGVGFVSQTLQSSCCLPDRCVIVFPYPNTVLHRGLCGWSHVIGFAKTYSYNGLLFPWEKSDWAVVATTKKLDNLASLQHCLQKIF